MSISTGSHLNPVVFPEIPCFPSWQLNPNAPPFVPRPTKRRLTAARKKSIRILKFFPLNLRPRKLNNAQSAALRIRRKEMAKTIRLKKRLKELEMDVVRMVDSVEARQEILFMHALAAHSFSVASTPPPAKKRIKSGTKRKRSPSRPPALPQRCPSPPAVASPSIAQSFKGLKKGWFDKL